MYAKLCVLLLSISFCYAAVPNIVPEVGLMKFMMQSRDVSQGNPTRSLSCFDYYVPELNEIADQYKVEYAKCLSDADIARLKIDDTTQDDRDLIEAASNSACAALWLCGHSEGSIPYFECYANIGSESSKTMYTISANSSELLAQVREDYRLIEVTESACTNKSERAYVENTAATYEELQNCLLGVSPVPTPTDPPATAVPTAEPALLSELSKRIAPQLKTW